MDKINVGDTVRLTISNTGCGINGDIITVGVGQEGVVTAIKANSHWGYHIFIAEHISVSYEDDTWHMSRDEIKLVEAQE